MATCLVNTTPSAIWIYTESLSFQHEQQSTRVDMQRSLGALKLLLFSSWENRAKDK